MEQYKKECIEFLVESKALLFGEFKLKSGRTSPYFISTGKFDTGAKISRLGLYYANAIHAHLKANFSVVFGPAYKGIPLCVAASSALSTHFKTDVGYAFNRKEVKSYGEKELMCGGDLKAASKGIVIVDDVITSGKAITEALLQIRSETDAPIKAIFVLVDRQEKGPRGKSAIVEIEEQHGIKIYPIVTIREILEYLSKNKVNGSVYIDAAMKEKMLAYLAEFGVR